MFKPGEVAMFREGGAVVTVLDGTAKPTPEIPWPVVTRSGVINESELIPGDFAVLTTAMLQEPIEAKPRNPMEDLLAEVAAMDSRCDYKLRLGVSDVLRQAPFDWKGHWKNGTQIVERGDHVVLSPLTSLTEDQATKILAANASKTPLDHWIEIEGYRLGERRCFQCGADELTIETNGVDVRLTGSSCPYPEGLTPTEWELNVPSGKLVVANDLRSIFPLPEGDSFSVNTPLGCREASHAYAANGLAHAFVGNTDPTVYKEEGDTYKIGRKLRKWKPVASITTDLWWYSICDQEEFDRRCTRFSQDPKAFNHKVVSVKPGVYHFKHDVRTLQDDGHSRVYTTVTWVREPDPVTDFLALHDAIDISPNAYVQAKTHQWPSLYGGGKRAPWISLSAHQQRHAWQRVADQALFVIGAGVDWHERGFPFAKVEPGIPDMDPPSFRGQYPWYPFSRPYGGIFEAKLSPSFAKLAFRVLESVISFGTPVRDSAHSRDVIYVRARMQLAVDRYRELMAVHPEQADPEYVAWLGQEGRAEAWVANFPLGPMITKKHEEHAKRQRWLPEDIYAIAFDARKLKEGHFAHHPAKGGCWANKADATRYAIDEWKDNGQQDPRANCFWASHATNTSIPLYSLARVVKTGQVSHMGNVMVEVAFDYGTPWMQEVNVRKGVRENERKAITPLTKEEYDFFLPEAVSFFEAAEAKAKPKK